MKNHWRVLWREWLRPLILIALVMFSFRSAVADWNDVPTGSMKPTILEGDRIFINKVAYDLKFPFTTWRLAEWSDPVWGDIIVLLSPEDGKRLVKRVVGLPGDVIEVRYGRLFLNGEEALYESPDEGVAEQLDFEVRSRFVLESEEVDGREHAVMIGREERFADAYGDPAGSLRKPSHFPLCEVVGDGTARSYGGASYYGPCAVPGGFFFVMGDNRSNSRDSRYFGPVHRSTILGRATAVALSVDRERYFMPRWERFFTALR